MTKSMIAAIMLFVFALVVASSVTQLHENQCMIVEYKMFDKREVKTEPGYYFTPFAQTHIYPVHISIPVDENMEWSETGNVQITGTVMLIMPRTPDKILVLHDFFKLHNYTDIFFDKVVHFAVQSAASNVDLEKDRITFKMRVNELVTETLTVFPELHNNLTVSVIINQFIFYKQPTNQ